LLTTTLTDGLGAYRIGEKVHTLRLRKKMGLVELGRHTGLSAALLSKIERGRLFPTLPTLLRVALVFSVGLDYFFADDRKRHVLSIVRKKERLRFPDAAGRSEPNYFFESLDFHATERRLNAFYAEFQTTDPGKVREHEHAGVEFILVLSGALLLRVTGQEHHLQEGDSIYFDSGVAHSYLRTGRKPCSAVVVTVP